MRVRLVSATAVALGTIVAAAWAQDPSSGSVGMNSKIETTGITLLPPERYEIPLVLQPKQVVWIKAPMDSVLRGVSVPLGASVREGQEIAQLDRIEASARLKIAQAVVKERQAEARTSTSPDVAQARLEAAKAQAELAQHDLDRCTIKAPFAGRMLEIKASNGQYLDKGYILGQLADVSTFNAYVPVDRKAVQIGSSLPLDVEGRSVNGQVKSLLPLPESLAVLRELATPWALAVVEVANSSTAALEPGQRVRHNQLPAAPIATLPAHAVRGSRTAQVIRNGYVVDVPVSVLGKIGSDRLQVSGPFRTYDLVIVEAHPPVQVGTLVHFRDNGGSTLAEVTPPVGGGGGSVSGGGYNTGGSRIAPIGAPDSNAPRTSARPNPGANTSRPPARGTTKGARPPASGTPF
jgi:multidrug efflux pump subunit AcrA (membrane-fusion protein)